MVIKHGSAYSIDLTTCTIDFFKKSSAQVAEDILYSALLLQMFLLIRSKQDAAGRTSRVLNMLIVHEKKFCPPLCTSKEANQMF